MASEHPDSTNRLRLDKWLWHARLFKSRTLAGKVCDSGVVRVNSERITKAHQLVQPGDVLTFPLGPHIRIIEILALGTRRGPAPEARALYEDLAPPQPRTAEDRARTARPAQRAPGAGRPTKKERRETDQLKDI